MFSPNSTTKKFTFPCYPDTEVVLPVLSVLVSGSILLKGVYNKKHEQRWLSSTALEIS